MQRLSAPGIRSILWADDRLIDCVGGFELRLDGTFTNPVIGYGYRFDAVAGYENFVVIYERLGTKGLVLNNGKLVREINRSYYCADVYEYPIAIFKSPSGRILLAHCPDEYNRIEFEDIQTGERISNSGERKPDDFFHSRLRVNPDASLLLSAGWVWHPWSDFALFDVGAAILDSSKLDRPMWPPRLNYEVEAAEFISRDRLLVATSDESLDDEAVEGSVGPNSLAVVDAWSGHIVSSVRTSEPIGSLMPIDEEIAVGFHTYPKLFSLKTGEVIKRWKGIESGNQSSSIIWNGVHVPPIATDRDRRRFAVAGKDFVLVVNIDEPDT